MTFCLTAIKGSLFQSKFHIHKNGPQSPHDLPHIGLLFCSFIPYPPGAIASWQCLNLSIRLQSLGL